MKSAMIYLKTTETCQLDCSHCFTSGSLGRKIYFDVDKTIDQIDNLGGSIKAIEQGFQQNEISNTSFNEID